MNFQQLRYVRAAVQNGLNLTRVANELFTSQSGVSKQIRELEQELRLEIFVRRGKRLVGLTPAGEAAARVIEQLLQEADNLKRLSAQFVEADAGRLIVAATHNQANYVLPPVLLRFRELFPEVEVELRQGGPGFVAESLARGEADIGVATEAVDGHPNLQIFPCFTWQHVAIAPEGHPLLELEAPGLADLARYPIVTYSNDITGGSRIRQAFEQAGIEADIRLRAMDADVIKTYVRLGAGIGIVAQMAIENGPTGGLVPIPATTGFFGDCSTKIAVQQGALLRNYAYRLIAMLAPHLDADVLSGRRRPPRNPPVPVIEPFTRRGDLKFGPSVSSLAVVEEAARAAA